jgi:L-ascorbate metabolism protein UlaG (beta-lactamase superfamily)
LVQTGDIGRPTAIRSPPAKDTPLSKRIDEGLWAWKQTSNNNHMIALQSGQATAAPAAADAPIELAYFGGSAFRITAPSGLTLMLDPWRNLPSGNWDWYLYDFPPERVDIALSTHAHFDHDGVHVLDANVILDRLVGTFSFADVTIHGIADKHVTDSSHNAYDWADKTRRLTGLKTAPPDNCRSFDNSLLLIEVAGLRILHWGDNRPNPPDTVWQRLGAVDIALLPIDGSQHVLSFPQVAQIAARLRAKIVVPHHYAIWDLTTRGSTLLPPDGWMEAQSDRRHLTQGTVSLHPSYVRDQAGLAMCFGEHVAFDKQARRVRPTGG